MSIRQHYFYNITRKVITQFTDIFNDLVIARFDDKGKVKKYIKVPVKFAPKTKQWYWEELKANNDRRDHVLPIISVNLENVEYASDRQVNRLAKIHTNNVGGDIRYYNPVPYDFTFSVKIYSEYMVDITQIIEQVLPSFYPEAYVRITIPDLNITGLSQSGGVITDKLELRVSYEGSQKDTPVELDEESYRVLKWELTFKVQGYLFTPLNSYGRIHKIVQNYYISDEAWSNRSNDIDNTIGTIGNSVLQGVEYATILPTGTEPATGIHYNSIKYIHYPQPPVTPIKLYTTPYQGVYNYPLSVTIGSTEPVDEIWYTIEKKTVNTYIVDDNFRYIITDPYPTYLIMDKNENSYPTTLYTGPIQLDEGDYIIRYFGITLGVQSTSVYTSRFDEKMINPLVINVSHKSGLYLNPITIEVYYTNTSTLYYTIDGTEPDTNSNTYDIPITIQPSQPITMKFLSVDNTNPLRTMRVSKYYNYEDI